MGAEELSAPIGRNHSRRPLGEFVLIDQVAGRVARHHDTGIGIEFISRDKAVA